MTCPCEGKEGIDLAVCISPPPGEHEIDIPISRNRSIIINNDGIFIRQVILEDTLPFTRTVTKQVDPEFLQRIAVRVDEKRLACQAAKSLVEAARGGSLVAGEKLDECRGLVEKMLAEC
ncbi:MAG: hypothetical protein F7B78_02220 [Desulfurococcales archaeon]|nr:hypothetical protein [Desulfurococcales archaeon]